MARGNTVELATQLFATQTEAIEFFKAMLARYQPGKRVNEEDALHLFALLERHSEYRTKVGCGIDHFSVMMTVHGTRCFQLVRKDGDKTDFSYLKCIRSSPPPRKQEVSQAFRWVVRFDLFDAKRMFVAANEDTDGLITCAETKERITPAHAHLDHRPPMTFEVLVTTFLGSHGIAVQDVPIVSGQDGQVSPEIADQTLAEKFRDYHTRMANLDLVSSKINLAQSSRHRLRDGRIKLGQKN